MVTPARRARQRQVLYRTFSPETNRLYLLVAGDDPLPNLEIGGIQMKSADPTIGAVLEAALATLRPLRGVCLDTCGGLGYSAIALADSAAVTRVVTFEPDAAVLEVARHNPQSQRLFDDPKIELRQESVVKGLPAFPPASFDRVFHDPPRLSLAGELYGAAFYRDLFERMNPGGRLYHYTGSPGALAGKRVREGVMRRLREAGFVVVRDQPPAQGVSARRPG